MGNSLTVPEKLNQLEAMLVGLPQVACNVVHAFGGGIYIRQVHLRAGSMVMGHRHKTEHLNIMLTGRMTLYHENGMRDELTAPVIVTAGPGRKVAQIHQDVLWLNLFPTSETNVEKLEEMYLDKTEGWREFDASFQMDRDKDRSDYDLFLWEAGLSEEYVRRESERESDQVPFPDGVYKCKVSRSQIEGRGLFATGDMTAGEIIAPARLAGKRTPACRYTNHSGSPNAMMVSMHGDIMLMAMRQISGAQGGQDGEEITVDYRDAIRTTMRAAQ